MTEEKTKVRPLYNALWAYLKEAPNPSNPNEILHDVTQYEYINATIDALNATTSKYYDSYKITTNANGYVWISSMKGKLGGLINHLHAEYFNDEQNPLSGDNPGMVFNQSLNQTTSIVLVLELQRKIDEKLSITHDEKEKSFLKKLSSLLPSITNGVQLAKEVLDLSGQMGLDPHQVSRLFT